MEVGVKVQEKAIICLHLIFKLFLSLSEISKKKESRKSKVANLFILYVDNADSLLINFP